MTGGRGAARWLQRVLVALGAAVALLVLQPVSPAGAHSGLVSSTPRTGAVVSSTPSSATLTFNEPVNPLPASFQLYDTAGGRRQVTVTAVNNVVTVKLPGELARGTHVLGWRVVSADSHPISGAIPFSIGEASTGAAVLPAGEGQAGGGLVDIAYLTAQILGYLSLMAAVGIALFEVVVLRLAAAMGRARERVIISSLVVTLLAHAALTPLTFIRAQGAELSRVFDPATIAAGFSTAAGLSLALVVLGCCGLLLAPVFSTRPAKIMATALGTALLVTSVLPVGHTRTVAPIWLMMSTDVVHVLTGAMWFGGVIGLTMYLRTARRSGTAPTAAAHTVARFSEVAGLLVAALAVTGTVMSVLVVGSVQAMLDTNYGRTLLVKIGFAAVIALLAVWNRVYLVPAVRKPRAAEGQWGRLTAAVRDETALLIAVICVTGLLSMQSPNLPTDQSPPPPVSQFRAPLGSGMVTGEVRPARTGANEFTFELRGADGKPLTPVEVPELTATLPEAGLGPIVGTVRRGDAAGSYQSSINLPLQGRWLLKVNVRVDEFSSPSAEQTVDVAP